MNLHEFLRTVQNEFRQVKTLDECKLEADWIHLRTKLVQAFAKWKMERLTQQKSTSNKHPLWQQRLLHRWH